MGLNDESKAALVGTASRAGKETTEFRSTVIVQALVAGVALLGVLGVKGVELTVEEATVIVAGLTAVYTLGRSLLKAFGAFSVRG